MARRLSDPKRLQTLMAAASIDEMVSSKRSKRQGITMMSIRRSIADVNRRIGENDWSGVRPGTLVAVYAWCHEKVYGVQPTDLMRVDTWRNACKVAGRMLKVEFAGDAEQALAFIRWAWEREEYRVNKSRGDGRSVRRISWQSQFASSWLLTDYRVHVGVQMERGKRSR